MLEGLTSPCAMLRLAVVPSLRSKSPNSRWKTCALANEHHNRVPSNKQEGLSMRHSMTAEQELKPTETLDLDVCKHTGECSASKAVRRFLKIRWVLRGVAGRVPVQALRSSKRLWTS
ncbi:hypothetical protein EMIT0P294_80021 [Pseudomonas sp. IT-P294]